MYQRNCVCRTLNCLKSNCARPSHSKGMRYAFEPPSSSSSRRCWTQAWSVRKNMITPKPRSWRGCEPAYLFAARLPCSCLLRTSWLSWPRCIACEPNLKSIPPVRQRSQENSGPRKWQDPASPAGSRRDPLSTPGCPWWQDAREGCSAKDEIA
jgi:hypothetical protein